MAEFQEVIRQFNRMCDTCNNCECGLSNVGGTESCYGKLVSLPVESEKAIMAWAAEHPEPVYPTWGEWLEQQGITKLINSDRYEEDGQKVYVLLESVENQIPADIAQKLGIAPKEG